MARPQLTVLLLLCTLLGMSNAMKALVPAYFETSIDANTGLCDSADWVSLANGGDSVIAIVNPLNGPVGPALGNGAKAKKRQERFEKIMACVSLLRSAGVEMLGYVSTKVAVELSPGVWEQRGFRDEESVLAHVQMYVDYYPGVTGIFFDEASSFWQAGTFHPHSSWGDHSDFYQRIFTATEALGVGLRQFMNPGGAFVPDWLADMGDSMGVVIFEGSSTRWNPDPEGSCEDQLWTTERGQYGPGPWCPVVPVWDGVDQQITNVRFNLFENTTFAALVYGFENEEEISSTIETAQSWGINLLYITDRDQQNPWKNLPSYWKALLEALQDSEEPGDGLLDPPLSLTLDSAQAGLSTTTALTGCQCYWDENRYDCACCSGRDKYAKMGKGIAGPNMKWNVGGAKGKGLHACYEAVMANDKCVHDYFTYMSRSNGDCGCKTSTGLVTVYPARNDAADYYRIIFEDHHKAWINRMQRLGMPSVEYCQCPSYNQHMCVPCDDDTLCRSSSIHDLFHVNFTVSRDAPEPIDVFFVVTESSAGTQTQKDIVTAAHSGGDGCAGRVRVDLSSDAGVPQMMPLACTMEHDFTVHLAAAVGTYLEFSVPTSASASPLEPAPPSNCKDSAAWSKKGRGKMTCEYVSSKPHKRCEAHKVDKCGVPVTETCPIACSTCPSKCIDSKTWSYESKGEKNCEWVAQKPHKRCRRTNKCGMTAEEACIKTCGSCPANTATTRFRH